MSGDGSELVLTQLLATGAVVLLMGGVIRLMDDFLDLRYDAYSGAQTLAMRLGEGTLPYSLLGFAIACLIDPELAVAIMIGAYAVGMAGDFDRQLPTGLFGYQESLILVALAFCLLPAERVVWAVSSMLAVQIADDLEDLERDRFSGNPNLARRLGTVESKMLGLAALTVAALLDPVATALVFAAVPAVGWAVAAALVPRARYRGWHR